MDEVIKTSMKHPKDLPISDYNYFLPEELIALRPAAKRDASRLLIARHDRLSESTFEHLPNFLTANTVMVFNNARVIEARLIFRKATGGQIEVFCLEPADADLTQALQTASPVIWKCLVGRASSWPRGAVLKTIIATDKMPIELSASQESKSAGRFNIEFSWTPPHLSFAEVLHFAGAIPLPPYIKREPDADDTDRYQTIFAKQRGSVAAPTAGLHFTPQLMQALSKKNIRQAFVTLHVGAGTFMPVKSDTMEHHSMHSEVIEIPASLLDSLLENDLKNIVAVGTTSLRTLESIYWLGQKVSNEPQLVRVPEIQQWDPYETESVLSPREAVMALKNYMQRVQTERIVTRTSLLIAPGYRFRITDILITNFHQPRSTLLLLVAAFIGDDWKKVYEHAIENKFRFLSYGDACLFFRQEQPRE